MQAGDPKESPLAPQVQRLLSCVGQGANGPEIAERELLVLLSQMMELDPEHRDRLGIELAAVATKLGAEPGCRHLVVQLMSVASLMGSGHASAAFLRSRGQRHRRALAFLGGAPRGVQQQRSEPTSNVLNLRCSKV